MVTLPPVRPPGKYTIPPVWVNVPVMATAPVPPRILPLPIRTLPETVSVPEPMVTEPDQVGAMRRLVRETADRKVSAAPE